MLHGVAFQGLGILAGRNPGRRFAAAVCVGYLDSPLQATPCEIFDARYRVVEHEAAAGREVGARARAMLVQAAAEAWGVDPSQVRASESLLTGPGGQKADFGEMAEAAMALPVPESVELKAVSDFRLVGASAGRLDVSAERQHEMHPMRVRSWHTRKQWPRQLCNIHSNPPCLIEGKAKKCNFINDL